MDLPEITHVPPLGPARLLYTYYGQSLLGSKPRPIYLLDNIRSRPTLILGTTGTGKTQGMLSRAYQDASKGRPVVFIDGKGDSDTWNTLYYYNSVVAGRPFYALFPLDNLDHLSNSWNPLYSTTLSVKTVVSSFFNSYSKDRPSTGDGVYYTTYQSNAFSLLCRALHNSGLAYNLLDVAIALENHEVMDTLAPRIRPEGMDSYSKLLSLRKADPKEFRKNLTPFINFLRLFEHWSLICYRPEIDFESLYESGATIYICLPVNQQREMMSVLGNVIINHLKAFSAHIQTMPPARRQRMSVFVDEAAPFMDEAIVEWISKVRSSGMFIELGVQGLEDLSSKNSNIGERVMVNVPNVLCYNPNSVRTARWFSDFYGCQPSIVRSTNIDGDDELATGSERLGSTPKIWPELPNNLRLGQFLLRPAVRVYRPIYAAGVALPPVPPSPDCHWHGHHDTHEPTVKGLYLSLLQNRIRTAPPQAVGGGNRRPRSKTLSKK